MIATLTLVAASVIFTVASGGSPVMFLLAGILGGVALGRVTVWRRRDNTPVTRDQWLHRDD